MSRICSDRPSTLVKYGNRVQPFPFPERQWPNKVLKTAPVLFSTDLRDGNQSLPNPMTFEQKLSLYKLLVSIGFKEIEVAYPCANQAEFDFVRHLIETPGLIPEDVLIQVITPCQEEAIKRAVESVRGAKQAILFTYLPSSDNYRDTVLKISEDDWVERARWGAAYARSITKDAEDPVIRSTRWTFNFGFEDFANARIGAIIRCTEAVRAEWNPSQNEKMIIGVASSVEASTPNVFADQIECLSSNISNRDTVRLTVHTHNDRGGAVASAELASLAGADRIEGCLFGNGERAGNMDLVVYALNLLTQGIEPGIDLSRLDEIRKVYEDITELPVHPRTPYSGAYYLKAFSGAHQDAISKGLRLRTSATQEGKPCAVWPAWRVPYLPLDPADIGRSLEDVVGINSQSGKGGVAWVINLGLGLDLPPGLARTFSKAVKERSIQFGREMSSDEVCMVFLEEYQVLKAADKSDDDMIQAVLRTESPLVAALGQVVGLSSLSASITSHTLANDVSSYAAYANVTPEESKPSLWGVGLGVSLQQAKLRAVVSALQIGGYIKTTLSSHYFTGPPQTP
ncbi:2-isopropylmalate synthase [Alternaria tenuissima]|uniref:2-isopropylmalate synthase n=2 Tax=Alternaria alternata complex TaxID=187734 RepID=A0A4V1WPV1_ALTAL|nr:2-isopropylmalate synthase [Alternaria alternata]RYN85710.1 2-isopropylmalate synthase [Alternaria tenuissima]RYO00930.1 2-isopropylmalate synthase [Alternaria tenuissima]RYO45096.1 2-isopropylmalate synthase [Alternaria tenuissima]